MREHLKSSYSFLDPCHIWTSRFALVMTLRSAHMIACVPLYLKCLESAPEIMTGTDKRFLTATAHEWIQVFWITFLP